MANRIIRGFWDCSQCGTKGIDGLLDTCPNCGSGKGKDVRYYMKKVEEVSDQELAQAGLSREESDGQHKEWVCAYCGFLNNYADEVCVRCGAPREEKESDYGGDTSQVVYERDKHGNLKQTAEREAAKKEKYETTSESDQSTELEAGIRPQRGKASPLRFVFLAAAALLLAFLLWPHTYSQAISGFEWNRTVTVEELQTFQESGWTLPSGARQTNARREFYNYQQVLDHYETVYETRTRRVIDHYDTSYTYTDNGNGTFSEHEVQTPVYVTETYQEPVRRPVYRNEPVYRTKYYYDIDRWVTLQDYSSSGEDHDPHWSTAYSLTDKQRDTMRSEEYYTIYTDTLTDGGTERRQETYDTWKDQAIGDGFYVTRNRLGMEYSRKEK